MTFLCQLTCEVTTSWCLELLTASRVPTVEDSMAYQASQGICLSKCLKNTKRRINPPHRRKFLSLSRWIEVVPYRVGQYPIAWSLLHQKNEVNYWNLSPLLIKTSFHVFHRKFCSEMLSSQTWCSHTLQRQKHRNKTFFKNFGLYRIIWTKNLVKIHNSKIWGHVHLIMELFIYRDQGNDTQGVTNP